jgi:large repetitive protein
MDSSTINPSTFKLLDQATLQQVPPSIPDGVHYNEPTKVATFTPAADLQNGRTYEATITSGVKDQAGNTLAQQTSS